MRRRLSVERLHNLLGVLGRHVHRAIAKVDHELWMSDRPRAIPRVPRGMSRVGSGSGVSAFESGGHGVVDNRTAVGAIPDALKFPVPVREGQPHLEVDCWL